jgi:predicted metal-dependent hydrolase
MNILFRRRHAKVKRISPEIKKLKAVAHALAQERLKYFNEFYGFRYQRVTIRDQKTRWGSCSQKGNLNFNYRIALLPPHLTDYIIVHELSHLAQMNHSKKFWELVAKTIPDYAARKNQLRSFPLRRR